MVGRRATIDSEDLHQVEVLAVCVTANSDLLALVNMRLDHGGFVVANVLDGQDDLVDVFERKLLALLETLDDVVDKLLCHLVSQLHTVVV